MSDEVDGQKAVYATPAWHQKGTVKGRVFDAEEALAVLNPTGEPIYKGRVEIVIERNGVEVRVPFTDKSGMVDFDHETNQLRALSVMDKDYPLFQRDEQFLVMDKIIGLVGGAHYAAAVNLRKGTQTVLTADMGEYVLDPNGIADRGKRYLVGFNSWNGTWRLRFKFSSMRGDCANMSAVILRGSTDKNVIGSDWSTKHTTNMLERVEEAAKVLGLWKVHENLFEAQAEHMIHTPMHPDKFGRIIEGLFTAENPKTSLMETDREAVETVRMTYELSPAGRSIQDTIWGGFNAVTQYHDHVAKVRGGKSTTADDMRFIRQFEDPTGLKQRAWDEFWNLANDTKPFVMPDLAVA